MITKKRSAGILLCLVWMAVFTMLRPASAEGTGTKADPYKVSTWSDLNNLMHPSDFSDDNRCNKRYEGCYINLTDNITAGSDDTYLEVANDAIVFLDLNGKTIDRGLENPTENGYVIKVKGRLTLDDTVGGGKITGGNNSDDYSGGVYVESGSFTMNDGSITGNSAGYSSYGGGVYVKGFYDSTITFIMNSGTISDNFASYGAGVYVASMGSFTLSGGTISGNRGGVAGGGVFVDGTFTMNNGTISGNHSPIPEYPITKGGGVYVGGTFNMNNGTISDNIGINGGGVYVEGTFNMNNGTISDNIGNYGGGVYVNRGPFNISGAPIITGNQKGGTITDGTLSGGSVNNVYLPDGKYITVTGALDASASIGVTLGVTLYNYSGRFTDTAETNLKNNDPGKFASDNNEYEAGKFTAEAYPDIIRTAPENNGQLFLGFPVTVRNIRAEDKEYDGNTNAKLDTSEAQFTDNHGGVITGLSVTAAGKFDNKDAGDAKTVNISDLSLTVPGENFFLPASSGQQTTAQAKITPKPLTVTPDSGQGKTFGAADPELTRTQSGLVEGDSISGALSREAGENAGTYKITQGTLSAGGNYSSNFTENVVFTIAKAGVQSLPDISASVVFASGSAAAAVTGMPEDAGKLSYVLGEAHTTGSVSLTDSSVDAGGKVSAAFANGAAGDVITLPVTIRSENYEDSTVNVVFTLIEKENVPVILQEGPSGTITYGEILTLHAFADTEDGNGVWTWTSSDESVAAVRSIDPAAMEKAAEISDDAEVTTLKIGQTDIRVVYGSDTAEGSALFRLTVEPRSFENENVVVTLSETKFDHDGTEKSVNVVSVMLNGVELKAGIDYEISGDLSGTDTGTYTVTIRGTGNYSGTVSAVWKIKEPEPDGFYFFRLDSELPGTGITVAGSADIKDVVSYRPVNMELLIPQLDLMSSIVSVPHTEEGYPVRELGNDAGLLEGFALPGSGISLIAGHNTLDAESFGPFAAIRLLEAGDRFFIRRDDGELLRFEVYANEKIGSADVEGLRQTAEVCEDSLTLLTCEDELPEGGYANRRIVSAKLIK